MASRGFPSMTALLALLAIAGYQNKDKIADWLSKNRQPGAPGQDGLGGLLDKVGGAGARGNLERRARRVARPLQAEWSGRNGELLGQDRPEQAGNSAAARAGDRVRRSG